MIDVLLMSRQNKKKSTNIYKKQSINLSQRVLFWLLPNSRQLNQITKIVDRINVKTN